jgi:hypothetical protein
MDSMVGHWGLANLITCAYKIVFQECAALFFVSTRQIVISIKYRNLCCLKFLQYKYT